MSVCKPTFCLLIAALLALSCSAPPPSKAVAKRESDEVPPTRTEPTARNLIVISIDALRADRLGAYGYDRETSPAIDAMAEEGIVFERAFAESSWTLPSHLTLFTGLYPTTHATVDYSRRLPDTIPTLAEVLRDDGFITSAFVEGGYLNRKFGYDRGFTEWHVIRDGLPSMVDAARGFVQESRGQGRFFLFLHSYSVHCPYHPSEPYRNRFATGAKEPSIDTTGHCGKRDFARLSLTERQIRRLSDHYDGSIRETDDALRGFFDFLDSSGALDDTLLVLLSDHGEQFMEHGEVGHEGMLNVEVLRVPLIFAGSGTETARSREPAGLIDVMPTALSILEVDGPATQGRSLVSVMISGDSALPDRPLFSEHGDGPEIRSIIQGRRHLIVGDEPNEDPRRREMELYDLAADPTEQNDLAASHPQQAERLAEIVDAHFDSLPREEPALTREPTDAEIERLRSLGYVE